MHKAKGKLFFYCRLSFPALLVLLIYACTWFPFQTKPKPGQFQNTSPNTAVYSYPVIDENPEEDKNRAIRKQKMFTDKYRRLFDSENSVEKAYFALKNALPSAIKTEMTEQLFSRFVEAPAFLKHNRKGEKFRDFIALWVQDALSQKDDEIRQYYSKFYYRVRPTDLSWRVFNINKVYFHPGDTVQIISHIFRKHSHPRERYQVVLEKLQFNNTSQIGGYKFIKKSEVTYQKRCLKYAQLLKQPGLYRISITHSRFFQQFYVQVSLIDALARTDGSRLLIWAASHGNKLSPPYKVTLVFGDGKKYSVFSDSSGLCVFVKQPPVIYRQHPVFIIVGKDGHRAFVKGYMPQSTRHSKVVMSHLSVNQHTYLEGEEANFFGYFKFGGARAAPGENIRDSVIMSLWGPGDIYISQLTAGLDSFGLFAGCIPPRDLAEEGNYRLVLNAVRPLKGGPNSLFPPLETRFKVVRHGQPNTLFVVQPLKKQLSPDKEAVFKIGLLDKKKDMTDEPIVIRWNRLKSVQNTRGERIPGKLVEFIRADTLRFPPTRWYKAVLPKTDVSSSCFIQANVYLLSKNKLHFLATGHSLVSAENTAVQLGNGIPDRYLPPKETVRVSYNKAAYGIGDKAVIRIKGIQPGGFVLITAEGGSMRYFLSSRVSPDGLSFERLCSPDLLSFPAWSVSYASSEGIITRHFKMPLVRDTQVPVVHLHSKTVYKPGENYRGTISVSDAGGKPVKAGFSVSLVAVQNAGVLPDASHSKSMPLGLVPSIVSDNGSTYGVLSLHSGFSESYATLFSRSNISSRFWRSIFIPGDSEQEEGFYIHPVKNKKANNDKKPRMLPGVNGSSGFKWRNVWLANCETDEFGKMNLEFNLPDQANTWALVIRGSSVGGAFQYIDTIYTRTRLHAALIPLKQAIKGDSLHIESMVKNYTEKKTEVRLELITGMGVKKWRQSKIVPLDPGQKRQVYWPWYAPLWGRASLRLEATAHPAYVADSTTLAVLPLTQPDTIYKSGFISYKPDRPQRYFQLDYENTAGNIDTLSKLSIWWWPTMFQSALASLKHMLFKKNRTIVETGALLGALRAYCHENSIDECLVEGRSVLAYVKGAVNFLALDQESDGGWPWQDNGAVDDIVSSYIIIHMSEIRPWMKNDWHNVLENGFQTAVRRLIAVANHKKNGHYQRLYSAYAVCRSGSCEQVKQAVLTFDKFKAALSSAGLAMLIDCLWELKLKNKAGEALHMLVDRTLDINDRVSWSGDVRHPWFSSSVEATAVCLKTLLRRYPYHPLVNKTIPFFTKRKTGELWVNAKTTAFVLASVFEWSYKFEKHTWQYSGKIFFNGKKQARTKVLHGDKTQFIPGFVIQPGLIQASNKLIIGFNGKGQMLFSTRFITHSPFEKRQDDRHVVFSKHFEKLLFKMGDRRSWVLHRDTSVRFSKGDEVLVSLQVRNFHPLGYMALQDNIPAGFELLVKNSKWEKKWLNTSGCLLNEDNIGSGCIRRCFTKVSPGKHTYYYVMRARIPGKYHVQAAQLSSFYDESQKWETGTVTVRISEDG